MAKKSRRRQKKKVFRGIPAAPGIAVGPAHRLEDPLENVPERDVPEVEVKGEIQRFRRALKTARSEIRELQKTTRRDLGEDTARIFDVQLMVLKDPLAVERTENAIRTEHKNAEFLFLRYMSEMRANMEALSDPFFRDRAVDLVDVKKRVLGHLMGRSNRSRNLTGILLARELAPSDAMLLEPGTALGFATDFGGPTSHAVIMARARGIPAVVGVAGLSDEVRDGDVLALDGFRGVVEINPTPATLNRLKTRQKNMARLKRRQAKLTSLPPETLDGRRILLSANMELPSELDFILERGAEGIGLFRTEFFFMLGQRAPTEDEQVEVYRQILEHSGGHQVTIRALDVGGDKVASYLGLTRERNPVLGMRGIRYLIDHPTLFMTQLKAVLRASVHGHTRLLIPMVSSLEEFRMVKSFLRKAMAALKRKKLSFDPELELGAMIEVPSAVMMADELSREADFLSVGSNDLIQYMLAIDRDNETLSHMFQPHHPAVLRAFHHTVEAAHRHGKPVSICGELAGRTVSVPLLVGLGFDQISVSPFRVPDVKEAVRALRYRDCLRLAQEALSCSDSAEVAGLMDKRLGTAFTNLLDRLQGSNGDWTGTGGKPAERRGER